MMVKTKTSDKLAIFIQMMGKISFIDSSKIFLFGAGQNLSVKIIPIKNSEDKVILLFN
jgi:hypothetical protein